MNNLYRKHTEMSSTMYLYASLPAMVSSSGPMWQEIAAPPSVVVNRWCCEQPTTY